MTNKLQDIFAETTARSGDWVSFSSRSTGAFIWQVDDQGPFQALHDAVSSVRQYLLDRRLDAGVKAAREGIESVMAYLAQGGTFTTARDAEGLDAGYYIARTCLPYDFTALGVVEMSGAVQHVSKVRYYHQDREKKWSTWSGLTHTALASMNWMISTCVWSARSIA